MKTEFVVRPLEPTFWERLWGKKSTGWFILEDTVLTKLTNDYRKAKTAFAESKSWSIRELTTLALDERLAKELVEHRMKTARPYLIA